MRYHVRDTDMDFDNYEDAVDYCISDDYHWDDDWSFKDYINDSYGSIEIGGRTYYAYDIVEAFDDSMLDDLRSSWCENENENDKDEAIYDLRNAVAGDVIECQAYYIEVIEDEEEDEDINDDCIEATRRYYDEQTVLAKQNEITEKRMENDMISLFQTIGG